MDGLNGILSVLSDRLQEPTTPCNQDEFLKLVASFSLVNYYFLS